jgi:hypothetical protein
MTTVSFAMVTVRPCPGAAVVHCARLGHVAQVGASNWTVLPSSLRRLHRRYLEDRGPG